MKKPPDKGECCSVFRSKENCCAGILSTEVISDAEDLGAVVAMPHREDAVTTARVTEDLVIK
ncbi:hypothetical protein SynBMKMC1_02434 [Synechococcus sp. BMK-MC-1]|nr:hypothetical protein SynBMKMC1_02434 [Synechococcus sp. BMK-MC-1]